MNLWWIDHRSDLSAAMYKGMEIVVVKDNEGWWRCNIYRRRQSLDDTMVLYTTLAGYNSRDNAQAAAVRWLEEEAVRR